MSSPPGNDREEGGDANASGLQASDRTIVVASVNQTADIGALEQTFTPFSNPGSNILVAASGSNILASSRQLTNSNGSVFGSDYETLKGTSFAAPIVSGVISLMLEANPGLGWRDVQEILAYSATKVPDHSANPPDDIINGGHTWNGGGLRLDAEQDYGFGHVDALAAVRLAETWTEVKTLDLGTPPGTGEGSVVDGESPLDITLPGNGIWSETFDLTDDFDIESVTVRLDFEHSQLGDLTIRLISPDGTVSTLLDRLGKVPDSDSSDHGAGAFARQTIDLGSMRHWGENTSGTWTLQIENHGAGTAQDKLYGWAFEARGTERLGNDTYVYTDEFGAFTAPDQLYLSDTNRETLNDSSGVDTINVAAVTTGSIINLTAGSVSTIAGRDVTLTATTVIENAFTGDGDDSLTGNAEANRLWGGRGDDTIVGGAGNDVLVGGQGTDSVTGGEGADLFVIGRSAGESDTIDDFDTALDTLMLAGFGTAFSFADLVRAQNGADTTITLPDGQTISLLNVSDAALTEDMFAFRESFTAAQPWYGARNEITISGGEQDDFLEGSSQFDILVAGAGNDTLVGKAGADIFYVEADPGSAGRHCRFRSRRVRRADRAYRISPTSPAAIRSQRRRSATT